MKSRPQIKTPVLIAGAGPVGLVLAADLAWRGVACMVVDPQIEVNAHPRAISIGVRSMEHFRRLGLDQQVIDAGVPRDQALDVIYVTRLLDREIFRFRIPSISALQSERAALAMQTPEIAASPYYKTWTAQAPLERVLRRHVGSNPLIDLKLGWRIVSYTESDEGVDAILRDAGGREDIVSARYLAGCDGARSTVRAGAGIELEGQGTLGTALGLYFRAPQLRAALGPERGVMYWPLAPGCGGTIYMIDGGDEWVFNRYFGPGEKATIGDPVRLIRDAIGAPLDVELLSALDWQPRQLVARSYATRRVFLAGDACHLFVPTGGLGMNTGIGDVVDLAWKMAADIAGWAGSGLLASYDAERRPQGERNTLEAADNYRRSGDIFASVGGIAEDGGSGDAARRALAEKLPPKIKHFAPIGVHLGYRYEGSPIIAQDGSEEPAREAASYTPTARPGHRAPHFWLSDGRSVLDLFGRAFVLLCFAGGRANCVTLEQAAQAARMPLDVEVMDNADAAALYERRFVLVRPDGHVAWRSDTMPADAAALVATVCGC